MTNKTREFLILNLIDNLERAKRYAADMGIERINDRAFLVLRDNTIINERGLEGARMAVVDVSTLKRCHGAEWGRRTAGRLYDEAVVLAKEALKGENE